MPALVSSCHTSPVKLDPN